MSRLSVTTLLSLVVVSCLLASSLTAVSGADVPSDSIPGVVDLDQVTFESVVHAGASKYVFVEFYADWCGQCKNFIKEFSILGKAFEESTAAVKNQLVLAKVNAVANEELAKQFNVNSFPTLLMFKPGEMDEPQRFYGRRDAHNLAFFLTQHIEGFPLLVKDTESTSIAYVLELTKETFDSVVLSPEKDVMVLFYAEWCQHCNRFRETYQRLGQIFQRDAEHVVIARFNAAKAKNSEISERYGIRGFPTLYFFPKGEDKVPVIYNGKRTVPDLLSYLNGVISRPRLLDGELSWQYGVQPVLSNHVARFLFDESEEVREMAKNSFASQVQTNKEAGVEVYKDLMAKAMAVEQEKGWMHVKYVLFQGIKDVGDAIFTLEKGSERDAQILKQNIYEDISQRRE